MTERWKPTRAELKRILEEHRKWLDTDYEDGEQAKLIEANLIGADLVAVDMREAVLIGADLRMADLGRADLKSAIMVRADLRGANLDRTNLNSAGLSGANLGGANLSMANLSLAILGEANLSGAELGLTNFGHASLRGAQLNGASLISTIFGATMMRSARGLDDVRFLGECIIDGTTIEQSWPLPDSFLRGCGLPDDYIHFLHERVFEPIQLYSCFISYSTDDEKFASRLHSDLQAAGVRCWKWDHDARTGRKLWGEITEGIRLYEKVVLVASESSLKSAAVNEEIDNAIMKETELFKKMSNGKEGVDPDVLFPIALDEYVFDGWEHPRKVKVLEKVIADAKDWKNPKSYAKIRDKLINDLKKARRKVG